MNLTQRRHIRIHAELDRMAKHGVLNAEQVGKLKDRYSVTAFVRDDEIVIRPMMYLALTYDHRLIDGREAVSFLVRIKDLVEDPNQLLLDL